MESPYRGLVPYSDSPEDIRLFFGRDTERRVIVDNVTTSRISVLYGESGVGKSSLLNAAVTPTLRADPESLVIVYNSWYADPAVGLIDAIRRAAGDRSAEILTGDLTRALEALVKLTGRRVLVILDQFEEYFQYHSGESGPATFAEQFPRAVMSPMLDANFLLSIRSDSLWLLDFFKTRIPNLLANRIPVRHLTIEGAREAIELPLGQYNKEAPESEQVTLEPKGILATKIIEQIGRKPDDALDPSAIEVPAPYLQLVLTRLWSSEMEKKSRVLRSGTLASLGGGERIYEEYFADTLTRELDWLERRLAITVFQYLITPTGRKIITSDKELCLYEDLKNKDFAPVLRKLQRARILVTVPPPSGAQANAVYYQFAHDVLARAARLWRGRQAESDQRNFRLAKWGAVAACIVVVLLAMGLLREHQLTLEAQRATAEAKRQAAATVAAQQDARLAEFRLREEQAAGEGQVMQIQRSALAAGSRADGWFSITDNSHDFDDAPTFPVGEVHGIDISKFTPKLDWVKLKASRTTFVFVRSTQGVAFLDNRFADLWAAAKKSGIRRGAYHVYRGNQDPVQQAKFFLQTLGTLDDDDLPPAVDLSTMFQTGDPDMAPDVVSKDVLAWLQEVANALHRKPLIYGPSHWLSGKLTADAVHAYPVWIAQYGPVPRTPAGWKKWMFWQYSATGQLAGAAGIVNLNKFNGTQAEFDKFR